MERPEVKTENRRYLTTQEVADILRVRVETVRSYIKRGILPAVKLGRDYRIAAEDVDRLLQPRLSEARVTYRIEPRIRQGMPGIGLAKVKPADQPLAEPVGATAEFDMWAITRRIATGPPYTPEEIEQAEREMEEIIAELRANPPYPTIKEFMESTRGRGSYDPD